MHGGVGEQRGGVALLLGQGRNTSGHILSSGLRLTRSHWSWGRRDLVVAGGSLTTAGGSLTAAGGSLTAAAWNIVDLVKHEPDTSVHIDYIATLSFELTKAFDDMF